MGPLPSFSELGIKTWSLGWRLALRVGGHGLRLASCSGLVPQTLRHWPRWIVAPLHFGNDEPFITCLFRSRAAPARRPSNSDPLSQHGCVAVHSGPVGSAVDDPCEWVAPQQANYIELLFFPRGSLRTGLPGVLHRLRRRWASLRLQVGRWRGQGWC